MNILRKMAVSLCALILLLSLLGLAWSHVAAATILKRDTIKSWLEEADFYNTITDVVLQTANKDVEQQGEGGIPIDDPEVKKIVAEAFPPTYLQGTIEKALDGTYSWLEGDTAKPEFVIDLNDAKTRLAEGLSNYAFNRATDLPACSQEQMQAMAESGEDVELLNVECLPAGTDVNAAAATLRNELLNNEEFLEKTTYTGDDLQVTDNGQEVTLDNSPSFKRAQTAYKIASYAPYIYGVLILLTSVGIFFLKPTKRQGLRLVSIIFVVSGVLLGISYAGFNVANSMLNSRATELAGESEAAKKLASGVVAAVYQDVSNLLLWYAIGFVALGIIGLLVTIFFGTRGKNLKQSTDPEPPIDDSPKNDPAAKRPATTDMNRPNPTTAPEVRKPKKPPTKIQL